MTTQLLAIAKSQRGQGWLGLMEILDVLDDIDLSADRVEEIKHDMQHEVGSMILSGMIGCDEAAMISACNQCIESLIKQES